MLNCTHCNSPCEEEVYIEDKIFCCYGCKTVYEIIQNADMAEYYEMNLHPGTKREKPLGNYSYLDLEEIQTKLLVFQEGTLAKVELVLPQIHCSSCLWLLENISQLNEGVKHCQVNFVSKQANILFDCSEVTLRELAELLEKIGYSPEFSLSDSSTTAKSSSDNTKKSIFKIGLVGFCFGNIMLFSFPEYLGIDVNFENFQKSFGWLNLALSIPVLIFGAYPFLISAIKSLRFKRINIDVPISLGILALFFRSAYEVIFEQGAGYFDSFVGLIFFLLIGRWFQQKTYAAINFERNYKSYFPIAVTRKSSLGDETVTLEKIKVDDIVIVRNGELIPADSQLIEGEANIDYSFVTGESNLVSKIKGERLFAGGRQNGTSLTIRVTKEVDNSYLTKLWNNPVFHKSKEVNSFSDTVSKYFTIVLVFISLITGVVWFQIDSSRVAFVVTSVLIVACPCAIALAVPFTYGNSLRVLGVKKAFLRSAEVLDSIQGVTDIVFDKTGTLTQNKEIDIKWVGRQLSEAELVEIRSLVFQSSHPLSRQLYSFLSRKDSSKLLTIKDFKEEPGRGVSGKMKKNVWFVGKHKEYSSLSSRENSNVAIYRNQEYLGTFVFKNEFRLGVRSMIEALKGKYNVHLLSGDNETEKEYFSKLISLENLHFNQTPEGKLLYIKSLQEKGGKVIMLGDGLNDSGALMQADVGVAVAEDVHAFSPSSDIILEGNKISQIDQIIAFAKYSKQVVQISYVFSLIYNITGLYFALSGQLTPLVAAILMPLSSISTVLLVTVLIRIRANGIQ